MPAPIYINKAPSPWASFSRGFGELGTFLLQQHELDRRSALQENLAKSREERQRKYELEDLGYEEVTAEEPTGPTRQVGKTTMQEPESWGKPVPLKYDGQIIGYDYRGKFYDTSKTGWKPQSIEEAMAVRRAGREDAGNQTATKLLGSALSSWIEGKPLNPQQKQLVNKHIKGTRKTSKEVMADTKARISGKVESFQELMKRPPTKDELRFMIINDPYGILTPSGNEQGDDSGGLDPSGNLIPRQPDESIEDYLKRVGG
jgi:hypothetical protein